MKRKDFLICMDQAFPVLAGGLALKPAEGTGKVVGVGKAASCGNLTDRHGGGV